MSGTIRRGWALALALVVSRATAVAAQNKTIEIGTSLGYTKLTQPGASSVTAWGAPGASINASPTVYVSIMGPRPAYIEFQAGYSRISSDNNLAESIDVLGRLGWLSKPFARASWYAAADAAYEHLHASSSFAGSMSVSGPAYGGAIGYRRHLGRGAAVRVEAHYRWWKGDFDSLHELGIGVGFGGIL